MEKTDLDMRRALSQLPAEEARVLKRKFRKVWRKAMRAQVETGGPRNALEKQSKRRLGVGKHVPSRNERNARKQLVFDTLWKDVIEPLIQKFNNPDQPAKAQGKRPKKT